MEPLRPAVEVALLEWLDSQPLGVGRHEHSAALVEGGPRRATVAGSTLEGCVFVRSRGGRPEGGLGGEGGHGFGRGHGFVFSEALVSLRNLRKGFKLARGRADFFLKSASSRSIPARGSVLKIPIL
jgi:hypothetical protein